MRSLIHSLAVAVAFFSFSAELSAQQYSISDTPVTDRGIYQGAVEGNSKASLQSDPFYGTGYISGPVYRIQDAESAHEEEPEFEPEFDSPWEEPIETERHDFTQSTKVVGCGVRQFEYGFLFATRQEGADRETTYATPELMFRYGLNEQVELRARFNYAWRMSDPHDDVDSAEDLRLSTKIQVSEHCGLMPESALELRMSVPTGGSAFTTNRVEPGIDYIYGWELSDYFHFSASTGANKNGLNDPLFINTANRTENFMVYTQSAAVGAKLTGRTTGYFEWFGLYTDNRDDELSLSFLNFGVDYLINKNVVVDFRIGWGLTPDSDDIFAGAGGAFRF